MKERCSEREANEASAIGKGFTPPPAPSFPPLLSHTNKHTHGAHSLPREILRGGVHPPQTRGFTIYHGRWCKLFSATRQKQGAHHPKKKHRTRARAHRSLPTSTSIRRREEADLEEKLGRPRQPPALGLRSLPAHRRGSFAPRVLLPLPLPLAIAGGGGSAASEAPRQRVQHLDGLQALRHRAGGVVLFHVLVCGRRRRRRRRRSNSRKINKRRTGARAV